MQEGGFTQGVCIPCVFYHKLTIVRAAVHGDDFTVLGKVSDPDSFRRATQAKMEVKFKGRLERRRKR